MKKITEEKPCGTANARGKTARGREHRRIPEETGALLLGEVLRESSTGRSPDRSIEARRARAVGLADHLGALERQQRRRSQPVRDLHADLDGMARVLGRIQDLDGLGFEFSEGTGHVLGSRDPSRIEERCADEAFLMFEALIGSQWNPKSLRFVDCVCALVRLVDEARETLDRYLHPGSKWSGRRATHGRGRPHSAHWRRDRVRLLSPFFSDREIAKREDVSVDVIVKDRAALRKEDLRRRKDEMGGPMDSATS
jgi:hypothetical protein